MMITMARLIAIFGFIIIGAAGVSSCARTAPPPPTTEAPVKLQSQDIDGMRCVFWSDKKTAPSCAKINP